MWLVILWPFGTHTFPVNYPLFEFGDRFLFSAGARIYKQDIVNKPTAGMQLYFLNTTRTAKQYRALQVLCKWFDAQVMCNRDHSFNMLFALLDNNYE